jgi:hypothetical protein
MFVIEDRIHCEWQGEYASFEEALAELLQRAEVPWDQAPNIAPCTSCKTCGREYVVIEFDNSQSPWQALRRVPILDISASGIKWSCGFEQRPIGFNQSEMQ